MGQDGLDVPATAPRRAPLRPNRIVGWTGGEGRRAPVLVAYDIRGVNLTREEQAVDRTIVEPKVGETVVKLIGRDDDQSDVRYATRVEEEEGQLRGSPRGYSTFEGALTVFLSGLRERATAFERNRA